MFADSDDNGWVLISLIEEYCVMSEREEKRKNKSENASINLNS